MTIPPNSNPYALLAFFLSPWKSAAAVQAAADALKQRAPDWKTLLYLANLHLCAPLWFVRLRQDGLTSVVPEDLQAYLQLIHQANAERNAAFVQSLIEIQALLQEMAVPAVLLKGAATFVDDLYADPGARMMGDIDILVKPQHAEPFQELLRKKGYVEVPECRARHHLPRLVKPATPVAVEVHHRVASDQAGRLIPPETAWENRKFVSWHGRPLAMLDPTWRLMHTTAHALVSHDSFLESILSLAHLAEFSYLGRLYQTQIDWPAWLRRANEQGMRRQFRIFLTLAHRLTGMPLPSEMREIDAPAFHVARISAAGNALAGLKAPRPRSRIDRWKFVGARIVIKAYRRLNRLPWLWHNKLAREESNSAGKRFLFLAKATLQTVVTDFRSLLNNPVSGIKKLFH